ncbi:hypothetical protein CR513_00086, partial [Mucuna pruriens]
MSSLTYDSILVFAAHGSERPHLYIMSTSPLSFLVVGVGQDFTCKWIGFRCEIRLITTACEQLDSCFPGYSTDCAKDSSLLLKNHTISQGKAACTKRCIYSVLLPASTLSAKRKSGATKAIPVSPPFILKFTSRPSPFLPVGNQAIDSPCVNVMGPILTLSLLSPEASLATLCFLS